MTSVEMRIEPDRLVLSEQVGKFSFTLPYPL